MVHIIYLSNNSIAGPLLYRSMLHYIFQQNMTTKYFYAEDLYPDFFKFGFIICYYVIE